MGFRVPQSGDGLYRRGFATFLPSLLSFTMEGLFLLLLLLGKVWSVSLSVCVGWCISGFAIVSLRDFVSEPSILVIGGRNNA
jgi:hypothetical protein